MPRQFHHIWPNRYLQVCKRLLHESAIRKKESKKDKEASTEHKLAQSLLHESALKSKINEDKGTLTVNYKQTCT